MSIVSCELVLVADLGVNTILSLPAYVSMTRPTSPHWLTFHLCIHIRTKEISADPRQCSVISGNPRADHVPPPIDPSLIGWPFITARSRVN